MECPTCKQESRPLCPFYSSCKYRKADLAPKGVCWSNPRVCDIYKRNNKREPLTEEEEQFNPTER